MVNLQNIVKIARKNQNICRDFRHFFSHQKGQSIAGKIKKRNI